MIILLCLDDRNGMLFHNRRQSQDRFVRERILALCAGRKLWMNAYSYSLYAGMGEEANIEVAEQFLEQAAEGEYCLVETEALQDWESKIEQIVVFRWNKSYPFDVSLDLDLTRWECKKSVDFLGYSHDKITEETYCKKENLHE